MSAVSLVILDGLAALSAVGVASIVSSGDVISLLSRKGFVEMGLIEARAGLMELSVTRLRKGLFEARWEGPRSMPWSVVSLINSGRVNGRYQSESEQVRSSDRLLHTGQCCSLSHFGYYGSDSLCVVFDGSGQEVWVSKAPFKNVLCRQLLDKDTVTMSPITQIQSKMVLLEAEAVSVGRE